MGQTRPALRRSIMERDAAAMYRRLSVCYTLCCLLASPSTYHHQCHPESNDVSQRSNMLQRKSDHQVITSRLGPPRSTDQLGLCKRLSGCFRQARRARISDIGLRGVKFTIQELIGERSLISRARVYPLYYVDSGSRSEMFGIGDSWSDKPAFQGDPSHRPLLRCLRCVSCSSM